MTTFIDVRSVGKTAAIFALLVFPTTSYAATHWLRVGAPSCQKQGGDNNYLFGYSAYTSQQTLCPLLEQNGLQRSELTNFVVYLEDNSAVQGANVQLCRQSYDFSGGACGSVYFSGAAHVGPRAVNLDLLDESEWDASSFGSAYVLLSSSGANVASYRSRGYYADNSNGVESVPTHMRGQAAFCSPENNDDITQWIGELNPVFSDGVYSSGQRFESNELICPLLERDGLARGSLSGLTVLSYDANDVRSVGVSLCRAAYDNANGSCGAEETSSGTGIVDMTLGDFDTSAWASGLGSTYMRVRIPRSANAQISQFRGFYVDGA
jgi:hypothetical protein